MGLKSAWDWEVGQKTVVKSLSPLEGHGWQEEPYVSPDGETVAAIVQVDEGEFSVRVNDTVWDNTYEKIWYPRFSPDGRLTALCQQDMEWALAVDGELLGETTDYVWDTTFSEDGSVIATMYKGMEQYGVALNGVPWEQLYENVNQVSITKDGAHAAGVAQIESLGQADIEGFKKGVFTVVIDGKRWEKKFLNVWTPTFDPAGRRVAAQVRTAVHDYTIAVDDQPWSEIFNQVWEPAFHPSGQYVVAPVRVAGKWGVAKDGTIAWKPRYIQCLNLTFSQDGNKLWAIVATSYGQFTVCCNDAPWGETWPVVQDLVVAPNGDRAAVLANNDNTDFRIVVDGTAWTGTYDMAWPVVFSDDSKNAATMVEKNGRYTVVVNGKPFERDFDRVWPPIFSEDGTKVLIRAIDNNSCVRIVADVAQF